MLNAFSKKFKWKLFPKRHKLPCNTILDTVEEFISAKKDYQFGTNDLTNEIYLLSEAIIVMNVKKTSPDTKIVLQA